MMFYFRGPGGLRGRLNPCVVKEERSGETKPCIFPFQFQEKMYYGCTKAGFRDDLEPWCSTKEPFIYYVSTCNCRGRGVRNCHFLLIFSPKICLHGGGGGSEKPKNVIT